MNIVISILFKLPGAGFLVLLGDSPNQHPVRLHLYLDPCPSTGRTRVMCPPSTLGTPHPKVCSEHSASGTLGPALGILPPLLRAQLLPRGLGMGPSAN